MNFQYPLDYQDVISQDAINAGRVKLCMNYKDYVHKVNAAFYTGFLLAMCETQEDFDSITPADRMEAAVLARATARAFGGKKAAQS